MRQGPNGAVEFGVEFGNEDFPQHRSGLSLVAYAAGGHGRPQVLDDGRGGRRPEVGHQQGVLDLFPGVLVQITTAEQAQHAAPEGILGLGQPAAQPFQAACRGCDGTQVRCPWGDHGDVRPGQRCHGDLRCRRDGGGASGAVSVTSAAAGTAAGTSGAVGTASGTSGAVGTASVTSIDSTTWG